MSTVTRDAEGTVTGNTYDKYGSNNPVVKRLMAGFERTLDELFAQAAPRTVLDVGCGEGVLTHKWAQRLEGRIVGIDLEDPAIQAEWAKRQAPNLSYRVMKAESLPFEEGEFDLAAAIEVLEHVPDPEHTVAQMARVARGGHLLVSVPREPLWRGLNMARGAYLARPGEHAGPREPLVQAELRAAPGAARRGRRAALAVPVDHAPRACLAPTAAARGSSPSGSRRPGLVTFAYFSLASHSPQRGGLQGRRAAVVGAVPDHLDHLPAGRAAALAHDRVAPGAGARGPSAAGAADHPGDGGARRFLVVALALREPITDDVFDGSEELYWVLVVAVLAYAASYFARGWLAGHQRFGLYGGLVLLESCSRCLFALAVAIGIASGQGVVALGIAAAPLVSLLVVPWAIERRGGPAGERGSMREGAGFAGAVLAIMVAEQALLNGPVIAVDATAADAALAGFVFNVLLITRAPLQLFQAIQTSLLPHLSGITATGGGPEFRHAIRVTVLAIAGFTAAVVIGLGLIGPWAMGVLFGGDFDYARGGLDARRPRHGLPPDRRHAQPGGARAPARRAGRRGLARSRRRCS